MGLDAAFLADIVERPDDDAPRLIYADWLADNGQDERAEFIRVQIRLARSPADDRARPDLTRRELELQSTHFDEWAAPLGGLVVPLLFRRGFVEVASVSGEESFAEGLKAAVALAPIRTLTVSAQFVNGRHLHRAAPHMTRLRRLEFDYPNFTPGARQAATFFGRPELRGLTALYLMGDRNGSGLSEEVARAVIGSRALEGLTELTLVQDFEGLTVPRIRELAASPTTARLERLSLQQSSIDAGAMQALADSPHLRRLAELDLGHCRMPAAAWEVLLRGRAFAGLARLYLYDTFVAPPEGRPVSVGTPMFPEMYQARHPLREAVVGRFGAGVVDLESDSTGRWREGARW